jgi:hypothetical protein
MWLHIETERELTHVWDQVLAKHAGAPPTPSQQPATPSLQARRRSEAPRRSDAPRLSPAHSLDDDDALPAWLQPQQTDDARTSGASLAPPADPSIPSGVTEPWPRQPIVWNYSPSHPSQPFTLPLNTYVRPANAPLPPVARALLASSPAFTLMQHLAPAAGRKRRGNGSARSSSQSFPRGGEFDDDASVCSTGSAGSRDRRRDDAPAAPAKRPRDAPVPKVQVDAIQAMFRMYMMAHTHYGSGAAEGADYAPDTCSVAEAEGVIPPGVLTALTATVPAAQTPKPKTRIVIPTGADAMRDAPKPATPAATPAPAPVTAPMPMPMPHMPPMPQMPQVPMMPMMAVPAGADAQQMAAMRAQQLQQMQMQYLALQAMAMQQAGGLDPQQQMAAMQLMMGMMQQQMMGAGEDPQQAKKKARKK